MEAKDTVMTSDNLCIMVSQENRTNTLESKNCDGLDCNACQLTKQAEISFKAGIKEVVEFTSPLMGKISDIIADIRGDWTDPRQNCRDAHQLITEWQAKLKEWEL